MNKKYRNNTPELGVIESAKLDLTDLTLFTDDGSTTGYTDIADVLPVGAIPLAWKATVSTAATGCSTAIVQVGIAGDVDRFSADVTGDLTTTGIIGAACIAADTCKGMNAEQTVRITVTEDDDFTNFTAGVFKVFLYYIKTAI